jgi:hypothetical protein
MIPGEDLGAYLDLLGESVTVAGVLGRAVFDEPYAEAFGVASAGPRLTVRAADFPAAAVGQSVIVRAQTFKIAAPPEPDGTGVVVLRLHKT